MSFFRSVSVQISFGTFSGTPTWTDVSSDVRGKEGIQITRGRGDQFTQVNPGECAFVLNNRSGQYTVGNAGSPYYPNVKVGKKVWIFTIFTTKNWVNNGTFEDDDAGWISVGSSPPVFAKDGTRSHSGSYSLKGTWAGGAFPQGVATKVSGLILGKQYTSSAWVYVPTGSPDLRLSNGVGLGASTSTKDAWVQISQTWTCTATTQQIQVVAVGTATAGQMFWLDDVQVELGAAVTAFDSVGAIYSDRFVGYISEWPLTWVDGITQNPQVTIKAQDRLRKFAQAAEFSSFMLEEERLSGAICAYPMSEDGTTMTSGDLSGQNRNPLVPVDLGGIGTLVFGAGTGPGTDGMTAPVFTRVSGAAGWYMRAPFDDTSAFTTRTLECWFNTSTAGSQSLCELGPMSLTVNGSNKLNGNSHTAIVASAASVNDGHTHHAVVTDDGIDTRLYLDGFLVSTTLSSASVAISATGYLYVGWGSGQIGNNTLFSGTISHVCAYATTLDATAISRHYTAGTTGFSGDTSDARINRLLDYLQVDVSERSIETGLTLSVASQQLSGQQPLTALQDVTNTESGVLFIDRSGFVVFQARGHRYNQAATFSVNAEDLAATVQFSVDDSLLAVVGNDIIGSRPGGADQRVVNQDSIDQYGSFRQSVALLTTSDVEVQDRLNWDVQRYGDPGPRTPDISVDLLTIGLAFTGGTGGGYSDTYSDSFDALTLPVESALAVDVGARFTVTNMPATAPSTVLDQSVEGTYEDIGIDRHLIRLNCSDFSDNNAWILDDPVYSILDSTTRLVY